MSHSLSPIPQRLAKLLVASPDKNLAAKVEHFMGKNSNGLYNHLHVWLDDSENLELRKTLGTKACDLIEAGNTSALED